ncbi:response regulator [Sulfurimonas sp. SAG-AH-194-C20]|nr:response regulator [Sulfurimonas sp. SAG-AH-194-C20]MDF1878365.1 response regulator [Sulfurimonas sp. SAG-AH-194-C20]
MIEKYNYSILFVEDELLIRENYVYSLKMAYRDVFEASNGFEAYEVYLDKSPDIIISDINMPRMNGIDLVKKIRKSDSEVKIILLTAYTDTKILLEAVELQLSTYLVKPVSSKDLSKALSNIMVKIQEEQKQEVLVLQNGYTWDYVSKTLFCNALKVKLTRKECLVLNTIFMHQKETIVFYGSIEEEVWGEESKLILARLKTVVKNIRYKTFEGIIINNYGEGYSYIC